MKPEFVQHIEGALREVSTRDLGPITAERELSDLGLDSVAIAELLIVLEDRLNLSLEQKDIEQMRTFGDLERLVEQVRAGLR